MSDAPAAPAASIRPDPDRAEPTRVSQVIGLLHTLIAYGRNLADTLQQHAAAPEVLPCFAFVASIFSTSNVSLILARITRGLLRAAALEARLLRRAARGHQEPVSIRPPSQRKPRAAGLARPRRRPAISPACPRPRKSPTRSVTARSAPSSSTSASISASSPSRWIARHGKN
jgi:hypothetical protein